MHVARPGVQGGGTVRWTGSLLPTAGSRTSEYPLRGPQRSAKTNSPSPIKGHPRRAPGHPAPKWQSGSRNHGSWLPGLPFSQARFIFLIKVKCTSHKCTTLTILSVQISGFEYIHRVVQPSPPSNSRTFPSPRKETSYLSQSLPIPTSPNHWQPLTYFLSLWICLLWTFHIHEVT